MQADIIIVGAGAAGLMAAAALAAGGKQVLVLEERDRIGGRVQTIHESSFTQPVETGAEFVHGNLELTQQLLKEADLKTHHAAGSVWRSSNGRLFLQDDFIEEADALIKALQSQEEEQSVGDFLETHFNAKQYEGLKKSVQGYIEGYDAGKLDRASVLAMKQEWEQEEAPQYRVEEGYTKLLQFLYDKSLANSAHYQFDTQVTNIAWAFEKVVVTTNTGDKFTVRKIIVTVPVPFLQTTTEAASISFQPELPQHRAAFANLGYGSVIKILLQFKTAFWRTDFNLNDLSFLFSDETIPTWWTQHPQQTSLLTGWCAGPAADALKYESDSQLFQTAMQSLAHIFNLPIHELENNLTAWKVCNWAADPFTSGGYSYVTTTTKEALRILLQPVENTIYFAGEALYDDINVGTVEAALQSGKKVAQQVLQPTALR
jgi:monoamine oxidase